MSDQPDYKDAIIKALDDCLNKYLKYSKKRPKGKHKHLTKAEMAGLVAMGTAIGTSIGTVIPGVGNAIGGAIGAIIGMCATSGVEINNKYINKKGDNAELVLRFLGQESDTRETLLRNAVEKITQQRSDELNKLKPSESNKKLVAKYLATNIMKAIKEVSDTKETDIKNNLLTEKDKIEVIVDGIKTPKSKKIASCKLKTNDAEPISLYGLASMRNHK